MSQTVTPKEAELAALKVIAEIQRNLSVLQQVVSAVCAALEKKPDEKKEDPGTA